MRIINDLRYAARLLLRAPAFTIPAVASLALGIAVNTTTFSVVNAVLLRPIGAAGAGELVRIGRSVNDDGSFRSASWEELEYLREHARTLAAVAGTQMESLILGATDGAENVSVEPVTASYFTVIGIHPAIGRGFTADDDRFSNTAIGIVISDRLWRRRFGGDPSILGRTVTLNGHSVTIVGVAAPGFVGTFPGVDIDVWSPAAVTGRLMNRRDPRIESLAIYARLAPGLSLATARAELRTLAGRMTDADSARDRTRGFSIAIAQGTHPAVTRVARVFLLLMLAVTGIVLLVACANVASLLLARTGARRGEFAVRLALGAGRRRVMTQLLVESALLAGAGGAAGLLLAFWAVRALNAAAVAPGPTGSPIFFNLQLDLRVLLFTAAACIVTTLVFGLAPALQATRIGVGAGLKDASSMGGPARSRLRHAVVITQVALSFVLVAGSLLLSRSLRHTVTSDVGFERDGVVVSAFDLMKLGYDRVRVDTFYDELLRRTRALPGVERAAYADFVPMGSRGSGLPITIPGVPPPAGANDFSIAYNRVSDDYFATLRQPIVRGRELAATDTAAAPPVVIVNEAFARHFWPQRDALGTHIRLRGETVDRQVVGVARDARFASYGGEIAPMVFFPVKQLDGAMLTLHVRTAAPPADALGAIRLLAQQIDPHAPPYTAQTLREATAFALLPTRIGQLVFAVAGTIALLLAIGGLYALVCYTLALRMKEMGVRIALGAGRRQVFQSIAGGAMRLCAIGVIAGAVLAAGAMQPFSTLLYGLSPTDPVTYGSIAALLLSVTLAAGYVAARRGFTSDPISALRQE